MPHSEPDRVLLVEDCPDLARVYRHYLKNEPVAVEHAATGRAALARLDADPPAAVLLDIELPDMDGRRILEHIQTTGLPSPVLVITANGSIDLAVEAMRGGAADYLVKPLKAERLIVTLRTALERPRLSRLVEGYRRELACQRFHGFIGASPAMQAVYRMIRAAAPSKATVFVTGESGTGKEICAQAVHACGPRRERRFVALNCAAIPRELVESEIFGHARGAFTGALARRDGAARLADGGTLFLDEVCDMDPALQTKLLRFVQTGVVWPVGADQSVKVDVRLICATNKNPLQEVAAGRFREDLYYRLHIIPMHIPPLRERGDDIRLLARHFLALFAREEGKRFQALAPNVEEILLGHGWPGNVRQLQNLIHNVVVLNDGELVIPAMLPPPLGGAGTGATGPVRAAAPGPHPDPIRPLRQLEKEAIEAAVARCGGNVAEAADLLQISPSTIYRKRAAWRCARPSRRT